MKKARVRIVAILLVMTTSLFGLTGCLGTTGSRTLTLEPKVTTPAIRTEGMLTVGVDSTRAPYAGYIKGNLVGIDVDIAAALAEQLGLQLKLVDIAGQDATELLESSAVDVVMDVEEDGVQLLQGTIIGPYLISGPALFTKVEGTTVPTIDLTTLSGSSIVAQDRSRSLGKVEDLIGSGTVTPVANLTEALETVNRGTATYAAADSIAGSYLAVQYTGLSCVRLLPDSSIGVYLGLEKTNTPLAEAVTTALRDIRDNGVLSVVISKWLGPVSATVVFSRQAIVALDSNSVGSLTGNGTGTGTGTGAEAGSETNTGAGLPGIQPPDTVRII